jgi:GxxExxY protein
MQTTKSLDEITHEIIGAAIRVHTAFGPGLFEKTYLPPLVWELEDCGLTYVTRVPLHIEHRGRTLHDAYFIDLLVEDLVVVEIKAVEALKPVHLAQLITYVRLAKRPAGLLINFNVKRLVEGVRRVVNGPQIREEPSEPHHV